MKRGWRERPYEQPSTCRARGPGAARVCDRWITAEQPGRHGNGWPGQGASELGTSQGQRRGRCSSVTAARRAGDDRYPPERTYGPSGGGSWWLWRSVLPDKTNPTPGTTSISCEGYEQPSPGTAQPRRRRLQTPTTACGFSPTQGTLRSRRSRTVHATLDLGVAAMIGLQFPPCRNRVSPSRSADEAVHAARIWRRGRVPMEPGVGFNPPDNEPHRRGVRLQDVWNHLWGVSRLGNIGGVRPSDSSEWESSPPCRYR